MNSSDPAVIEANVSALVQDIIPWIIIVVGIILGFVLAKGKEREEFSSTQARFAWKPFLICLAIAIAGLVSQRQKVVSAEGAALAGESKIYTNSQIAPDGAVIAFLDEEKKKILEQKIVNDARSLLIGQDGPSDSLTAKITAIKANGLIVIRTVVASSVGTLEERAEGIVGGKIVTLVCEPIYPSSYNFAGSECEKKFIQIFGSVVDKKGID